MLIILWHSTLKHTSVSTQLSNEPDTSPTGWGTQNFLNEPSEKVIVYIFSFMVFYGQVYVWAVIDLICLNK